MTNITDPSPTTSTATRGFGGGAGHSVSALVAEYVRSLSEQKPELSQARAKWREVRAGIKRFSASDRLARGELYDRTLR